MFFGIIPKQLVRFCGCALSVSAKHRYRGGLVAIAISAVSAAPVFPQCVEHEKLTASDASADEVFGYAVALDGDVALVGATRDDCSAGYDCGAAYVYRFDGTQWLEEQKLSPSDLGEFAYFGQSVAIAGDTAVVGAPSSDCVAGESCGSVYVFRFDGTDWNEVQKLEASSTSAFGYFGEQIAIEGSTIVIGTLEDCANGTQCGSAYVFAFDGTNWIERQRLTPSDLDGDDNFGNSVGISGNAIVVGALMDDCTGGSRCGAAYVFRFDGAQWLEEQKLVASVRVDNFQFGKSVGIDGDTILVGSDTLFARDPGRVYVFDFDGTNWTEVQQLLDGNGHLGDRLGYSVALDNDMAAVGAPGFDTVGGDGAVYLYRFDGSEWVFRTRRFASNPSYLASLGRSVAVSGRRTLAGARNDACPASEQWCGSAYVFWCGPNCDQDPSVDPLDLSLGTATDCNGNGDADACDLRAETSLDCNGNAIPDECDVDSGVSSDCNANIVPDECESPDCNHNGVWDICDLTNGMAFDCDQNGVIDVCDNCDTEQCITNYVPEPCCPFSQTPKFITANGAGGVQPLTANRFLILRPDNGGSMKALRVTLEDLPAPYDIWNGATMWVGPPAEVSEQGASVSPIAGFPTFHAATLQCTPFYHDWADEQTLYIFHEGIVPGGTYGVDVIDVGCNASKSSSFSPSIALQNASWGDTLSDFSTAPPGPPNGVVSVLDVVGIMGRFRSDSDAISKARADLEPACLDLHVNITDVVAAVNAFSGSPYPYAPTASDPCNSTCANPLP